MLVTMAFVYELPVWPHNTAMSILSHVCVLAYHFMEGFGQKFK